MSGPGEQMASRKRESRETEKGECERTKRPSSASRIKPGRAVAIMDLIPELRGGERNPLVAWRRDWNLELRGGLALKLDKIKSPEVMLSAFVSASSSL